MRFSNVLKFRGTRPSHADSKAAVVQQGPGAEAKNLGSSDRSVKILAASKPSTAKNSHSAASSPAPADAAGSTRADQFPINAGSSSVKLVPTPNATSKATPDNSSAINSSPTSIATSISVPSGSPRLRVLPTPTATVTRIPSAQKVGVEAVSKIGSRDSEPARAKRSVVSLGEVSREDNGIPTFRAGKRATGNSVELNHTALITNHSNVESLASAPRTKGSGVGNLSRMSGQKYSHLRTVEPVTSEKFEPVTSEKGISDSAPRTNIHELAARLEFRSNVRARKRAAKIDSELAEALEMFSYVGKHRKKVPTHGGPVSAACVGLAGSLAFAAVVGDSAIASAAPTAGAESPATRTSPAAGAESPATRTSPAAGAESPATRTSPAAGAESPATRTTPATGPESRVMRTSPAAEGNVARTTPATENKSMPASGADRFGEDVPNPVVISPSPAPSPEISPEPSPAPFPETSPAPSPAATQGGGVESQGGETGVGVPTNDIDLENTDPLTIESTPPSAGNADSGIAGNAPEVVGVTAPGQSNLPTQPRGTRTYTPPAETSPTQPTDRPSTQPTDTAPTDPYQPINEQLPSTAAADQPQAPSSDQPAAAGEHTSVSAPGKHHLREEHATAAAPSESQPGKHRLREDHTVAAAPSEPEPAAGAKEPAVALDSPSSLGSFRCGSQLLPTTTTPASDQLLQGSPGFVFRAYGEANASADFYGVKVQGSECVGVEVAANESAVAVRGEAVTRVRVEV